jgi:hypothetical protein
MELIPRRNRFLFDVHFFVVHLERERGHMCRIQNDKSNPISKIDVSWAMGDSIPHSVLTWFLLRSYHPWPLK